MADWIASIGLSVDWIIASTAKRVVETVELLVARMPNPPEIQWDRELYLATSITIAQKIAALDASRTNVLAIGHNPGLETLVSHWSGSITPMPTGAIAWFECTGIDWRSIIDDQSLRLREVARPKELD